MMMNIRLALPFFALILMASASCTDDLVPPVAEPTVEGITGGSYIMEPLLIEGTALDAPDRRLYIEGEEIPPAAITEQSSTRILFNWPRSIFQTAPDSTSSLDLTVILTADGDTLLNRTLPVERILTKDTVAIAAGSFMMGTDSGNPNERPEHQVTISYPLTVMATEMKRDLMLFLMREDYEYSDPLNKGRYAVMIDDYREACLTANEMSKIYGLDTAYVRIDTAGQASAFQVDFESNGWRLPTEAEWEYMATNGIPKFPSDAEIDAMAWNVNNSGGQVKEVALKSPSGLGLYDILGNVAELCFDTLRVYTGNPITDPNGQPSDMQNIPIRGGHVLSGYWEARPTSRRFTPPPVNVIEETGPLIGFRLVKRADR